MDVISRIIRSKSVRAVAVASLLGAGLVVAAPVSEAAPVTKTLTANCKGRTAADDQLLGLLGQTSFPVTITSDVPATLEPNQSGSPISFDWQVILDASLVDAAVGFGVTNVVVKGANADIAVNGPTATKFVKSGAIPDLPITLTKGQAAQIKLGVFSGTLTEVGDSGTIAYSPTNLGFTIDVTSLKQTVSVDCSTGTAKAAVTQIKVPGSPNIVQPIQENAGVNEQLSIDVLTKYVTPGTTKEGETLEVDTSSLAVVDGPGTIVDGKLQVTSGAAGSTTSVTVEVCAKETIQGVNEVQRIEVDPTSDALKKGIAFTLKGKDGTSAPIDLMSGTNFIGIPDPNFQTFTPPAEGKWKLVANQYIPSTHKMPTAAEFQAAIEATPGVGPGNVVVTNPAKGVYDVEFVNALGQKNVDLLTVGDYWSVFPQELLDEIKEAAAGLLPDPNAPTTTLPGNATPEQYRTQLRAEIELAANTLNFNLAGQKISQLLEFELDQALANIDTGAAIGFLTSLFTKPPTTAEKVEGEAPGRICSQGVVDVVVAGGPGTDVEGISEIAGSGLGGSGGARLAFTG